MQTPVPVPIILVFMIIVAVLLSLLLAGINSVLKKSGTETSLRRKKVFVTAIIISCWILFLCFLATQNFLNNFSVLPPRMALVLLPPLLAVILISYNRDFAKLLKYIPQHWLVFVHSYRVIIGVIFYILFINHIVPVQMTFAGKNFDIFTGITAPLIGLFLLKNKMPKWLLATWNFAGILLIFTVVLMALLSSPYPFALFREAETNTMIAYFPFVLMPGFLIPLAFAMHIFSLQKTLHRQINEAKKLHDFRMRIIGIPIITILVTVILHRDIKITSADFAFFFFISMGYTLSLWQGDRLIIAELRSRFPDYHQTLSRIIFQTIFVALFTIIAVIIIDRILVIYIFHRMPTFGGTAEDVILGLIISSLMLIIYESIYFFQKWRDNIFEAGELKRIQMQNRLDSLKTQVNPHFLFNSLNSLSLLIREDKKKAASFVQEMAYVYRYILQSNENDLSTLEKEIQFIRSYMFLQRIRFDNHITGQIDIPASFLNHQIPSLTLQSLVDKAIRHNIISVQKPLCISMFISPANALIVSNNLQKKSALIKMQSSSLYNIRSRYEMHGQYDVKIEELPAEFKVTLPLINASVAE